MNFLQKLGQVALRIVGIASGLMPLVKEYAPQTAGVVAAEDRLQKAFNVVVTSQQMFTASGIAHTGSDRLKAATPFVAQLIQQVELLSGKKPKDEAKFEAAVTTLTGALADVLASFGD